MRFYYLSFKYRVQKVRKMATRLPKNYTPTDKEPFMNAKQKEFFRRKLNDWKDEIISETKETLNPLILPILLTEPPLKLIDRLN